MTDFRTKTLSRNKSYTFILKKENIFDKLKSYMTIDEINNSPALSSALTNSKKIRFNRLVPNEYQVIPIKVKNEKNQNLIDNINSFRKVYFNYNKNIKYSLGEISDMSKRNRQFIKRYNNMVNKSEILDKNSFNYIKALYEKQNYILPKLNDGKNLFKPSLLLSDNDSELKKYINFGFGSSKSNEKTISFLENINDNINNEENYAVNYDMNNNINNGYYNPYSFYGLNKFSKKQMKGILAQKRDNRKIQRTIDSLPDIDYFFSSESKDYLDNLKYFNSNNSSANFSTTLGNNNSSIFDRNIISNRSNILSMRNASKYTLDESKGKNIRKRNKKIKYNFDSNASNSFVDNNNNSLVRLIKKNKKRKKTLKKYINRDNYKQTLETLYNKIANTNDPSIYNTKIKNYLRFRRFRLEPRINKNEICDNMESLREKILKDDSIKKVIYFRKDLGNIFNGKGIINKKDIDIDKKVNEVEDQMIKVFSELKN